MNKPNQHKNFLMRVIRAERPKQILSKNEELIMHEDGSVRMNYANKAVRKNIHSQIKRYSNINVNTTQNTLNQETN